MSDKSKSRGLSLDDFAPLASKQAIVTAASSSTVAQTSKKTNQRVLPPSIATPSKFIVLGTLPDTSIESPVGSILKESCKHITVLEPHMENLDPSQIIPQCISPHWGWIPRENTKKNKRFYQLILIDTQSAEITPESDKKDPSIICFSKLKIKRILSEEDWNQNPITEKRFSRVFDPPSYNYFDYQESWYKILYDVNPRHSWYISFANPQVLPVKIPVWFQEWFCWVGPTKTLFPPAVVKYYDNFKDLSPELPAHLKFINFCGKMGVGWIAQHMLELHQHRPVPFPQHLCLKIKVTWWKRFDIKFLEEKFRNWKNRSIAPPHTPKKLAQPPREKLKLKGKSKAEIRATLLEALSSLDSDEDEEEINDPFYENEDDCFGILPPLG